MVCFLIYCKYIIKKYIFGKEEFYLGKGILGVLDPDIEYAGHLMDYLNRKEEFLLDVRIFTNEESLRNFIAQGIIDILLVPEYQIAETIDGLDENKRIKTVVILSSGNIIHENNRYISIYKFQSTENLIKELTGIYLEEAEYIPKSGYICDGKKIHIISVFSPCGGSGTTTTAFFLGQLLGEQKRVLIINWEPFSNVQKQLELKTSTGFSELMYFIKEKKPNISFKIKSMVHKIENIDYLMPADHCKDLYQLELKDIKLFLQVLKEECEYDVVIFDIGFLTEVVEEVFRCSKNIYLPYLKKEVLEEKKTALESMLLLDKEDSIIEKFVELHLPEDILIKQGQLEWEKLKMGVMANYLKNIIGQDGLEI